MKLNSSISPLGVVTLLNLHCSVLYTLCNCIAITVPIFPPRFNCPELRGGNEMAAIIHGAGAGAATALTTFHSKKLVARSRTNLPGSNFDFELSLGKI